MSGATPAPGRRFTDKVVLVTGAASGIGAATVRGFAREGASVTFTDIDEAGGARLAKELGDAGGEVEFLASDGVSEPAVEAAIAGIVAKHGRLDIAVNNVGNQGPGDPPGHLLHETALETFMATIGQSLVSTFLGMKHELIQMRKQGGGVIANTASLAAIRTTALGTASYDAAKAGVVRLTRTAAVFYAKENIRVNVVAPGLTATELMHAVLGAEKGNELAGENHPMGRMVEPDEIADAFLWLCSDQASGVTGHTVPVDGGWAAR